MRGVYDNLNDNENGNGNENDLDNRESSDKLAHKMKMEEWKNVRKQIGRYGKNVKLSTEKFGKM
jgi:hypothetical protein